MQNPIGNRNAELVTTRVSKSPSLQSLAPTKQSSKSQSLFGEIASSSLVSTTVVLK